MMSAVGITLDELRSEAELLGRPVSELLGLSILIGLLRDDADERPTRLGRDARLLLDDPTRDPRVEGSASPREAADAVAALWRGRTISVEVDELLQALRDGRDPEESLRRARMLASEKFAEARFCEASPDPPDRSEDASADPALERAAEPRGAKKFRERLCRAMYVDRPRDARRAQQRLRKLLGARAQDDSDLQVARHWLAEQTPRLAAEAVALRRNRIKLALTAAPLACAGLLTGLLIVILAAEGGGL